MKKYLVAFCLMGAPGVYAFDVFLDVNFGCPPVYYEPVFFEPVMYEPVIYEPVPVIPVVRPVASCHDLIESIDDDLWEMADALPVYIRPLRSENQGSYHEFKKLLREAAQAWKPFIQEYEQTHGLSRCQLRDVRQSLHDILAATAQEKLVKKSDADFAKLNQVLNTLLDELDYGHSLGYVTRQVERLADLIC